MRPLASASSIARYGAPARVRRRSFLTTANTPSTVRSSASSAIVVTGPVYGRVGWRWPLVRSPTMADVQGFRAVRYSGAAGPLADLVAPPYDAISQDERERLYTRSPYNVVHLTLPDSIEHAGQLYRTWLSDGVLERETDPAAWFVAEEYTGPDGVGRERRGVIASLGAEPYETGVVLPHERTYRRTKEERLQLLRATRVLPEPLFLLVDGPLGVERPAGEPDAAVDGTRLWRLPDADVGSLLGDGQLLIADGHHRYETALAFGSGEPGGTRV